MLLPLPFRNDSPLEAFSCILKCVRLILRDITWWQRLCAVIFMDVLSPNVFQIFSRISTASDYTEVGDETI